MKQLFYDLETTGTKYWRNSIHQLSGMVVVDGEVKEEFNFHVQPNPKAEIEDEALQIAGVTKEQVMAYPPLAAQALMEQRHMMKDFKLHSVAAQFGIELDESKLHDAMYDIYLTYEVYKRLTF